jgi:lipopolysaccharide/colanic/teichoic acid biosynthesis glycosyltransferase
MKRLAKANGVAEKTTMNINGNFAIDINEDILFDYPTGVDKVEKEIKTNKKVLYKITKRAIDIIGAIIGIILLIPTIILVYIARKILKEDQGPLFYKQLRYGKNGKIFRLYKFRSMCINADKKLKEYLDNNEDAKNEFEKTHKLQKDPRITKLGNFLRKTSLDELPQMINILKGEMSFVGPRPVISEEVEEYGVNKDKFLSVTPGLTGYWQVNGRSNTTYEERMLMELYYVENCSLWLDTKIFFKTFITVFKKEGAV